MNYDYKDLQKWLNKDTQCSIIHKTQNQLDLTKSFKLDKLGEITKDYDNLNIFTKDNKVLMYQV